MTMRCSMIIFSLCLMLVVVLHCHASTGSAPTVHSVITASNRGLDANAGPVVDTSSIKVDEQLYSRQLYVYGRTAQQRLSKAHVLLYADSMEEGEDILAEVAKNLALAGVGHISIAVPALSSVYESDSLSSSFSSPKSKGKYKLRGQADDVIAYTKELNNLIVVDRLNSDDIDKLISHNHFDAVVTCNANMDNMIRVNSKCRHQYGNKARFVGCRVHSVCGYVFDDFSDSFHVEDKEGETFKDIPLYRIMKDDSTSDRILIQSIEEEALSIGIDDACTITMTSNNGHTEEVSVIVKNTYTTHQISVEMTSSGNRWTIDSMIKALSSGTRMTIRKNIQTMTGHHTSFADNLKNPSFSQCNGCLTPRQDRANSICLLAALQTLEMENTNLGVLSLPPSRTQAFSSESVIGKSILQYVIRRLKSNIMGKLIGMNISEPLLSTRQGGVGRDTLDNIAKRFSRTLAPILSMHNMDIIGQACPATTSILGALTSQECIKAITCIHTPIQQFLMFESFDSLLSIEEEEEAAMGISLSDSNDEIKSSGDRIELGRVGLYGHELAEELARMKIFVVGSGAIGCEILKNFALMGIGEYPPLSSVHDQEKQRNWIDGRCNVMLTDMDHIERSNLNRQLLFRQRHVGTSKSLVATEMVKYINPKLRILGITHKIDGETESIFDDAFWSRQDVVVTALDNIDARLYVDNKCVSNNVFLLDSGTLGTKGNTQVVLPFLTESYASSSDAPEEAIPLCTLKSFPYQSDHCISWSRALFELLYEKDVDTVKACLKPLLTKRTSTGDDNNDNNDSHSRKVMNILENLSMEDLQRVYDISTLLTEYYKLLSSKADALTKMKLCVAWALSLFQKHFQTDISSLLRENPLDKVDEEGFPFWCGSRRIPNAVTFDSNNAKHLDFIVDAVWLMSKIYGLDVRQGCESDMNLFRQRVNYVCEQPSEYGQLFKPITPTNDNNGNRKDTEGNDGEPSPATLQKVYNSFLSISQNCPSKLYSTIQGESFEKDDLSLRHVSFATAASNLRCSIYNLPHVSTLEVQKVAGRIVPAVATTTSIVSGMVCLELMKIATERIRLRKLMDRKVALMSSGSHIAQSHNDKSSTHKHKQKQGRRQRAILSSTLDLQPKEFSNLNKVSRVLQWSLEKRQDQEERLCAKFRNSFVNVALGMVAFAQPVVADCYNSLNDIVVNDHSQSHIINKLKKEAPSFNMWDLLEPPNSAASLSVSALQKYVMKVLFPDNDDKRRSDRVEIEVELQSISIASEDILVFASFLPLPEILEEATLQDLLYRAKVMSLREDNEEDDRYPGNVHHDVDVDGNDGNDRDEHRQTTEYLRRMPYIDVDITCVLFIKDEHGQSIGEGDIRLPRVRLTMKHDYEYDRSMCDVMEDEEENVLTGSIDTYSQDNEKEEKYEKKESMLVKMVRTFSAWVHTVE